MAGTDSESVVLVPLKSFTSAKSRLAARCSPSERSELSRRMAAHVIAATAPLRCIVVCDDTEVATFARAHDAEVFWSDGLDLNGALGAAIESVKQEGIGRVVIAAGDLPFAHDLGRPDVLGGSSLDPDEVLIVGDRHSDGTNVISFATATTVTPSYGPGSLQRHIELARASGLTVRQVHDEALAWDIDTPEDLAVPPRLGSLAETDPLLNIQTT